MVEYPEPEPRLRQIGQMWIIRATDLRSHLARR
jgi:hypothetical protein